MTVRQPALETLGRHHRSIAAAWWFCFMGGPVWAVLLAVAIRRGRHSRDLLWVVDMPKEAS